MKPDTIGAYSTFVGREHRKKFGQFFTPQSVATFMCRWVISGGARQIYDPAFGLGAFFTAAKNIGYQGYFSGTEIDPIVLQHVCETGTSQTKLSLSNADYLSLWGDKHEAILCNPPYMRFQNFRDRANIFDSFERRIGLRLSGYTNSASTFLLKSIAELELGGRLAYIMPLEFLNAGYGTLVKSQLLRGGKLKALIQLEAEKEVFPDSITSVGIILVSNDGCESPVRFYSIADLGDLPDLLATKPKRSVPPDDLCPSEKWLKYFENSATSINQGSLISVKEYGNFSRGIATGANEFFVMSSSRARRYRLPDTAFSPCISKSHQITQTIFGDEDLKNLEAIDAEILLLDVIGKETNSISEYIRVGESNGYHLRYLTRMRRPWYKIERRTPAPLLFGVFSREKFKVIRNYSSAVNLTCFHGFHPNIFGSAYVDKLFLYFQSKVAQKILSMSMRRYGDGLVKFEPNDLNYALAPSFSWFDDVAQESVDLGLQACSGGNALPTVVEDIFEPLLKKFEPTSIQRIHA